MRRAVNMTTRSVDKKTRMFGFPLSMAGEGEVVRVVAVRRRRKVQERLLSMGIRIDDVIRVVQRYEQGAAVVSKENARYALGGGMALKIQVIREV